VPKVRLSRSCLLMLNGARTLDSYFRSKTPPVIWVLPSDACPLESVFPRGCFFSVPPPSRCRTSLSQLASLGPAKFFCESTFLPEQSVIAQTVLDSISCLFVFFRAAPETPRVGTKGRLLVAFLVSFLSYYQANRGVLLIL